MADVCGGHGLRAVETADGVHIGRNGSKGRQDRWPARAAVFAALASLAGKETNRDALIAGAEYEPEIEIATPDEARQMLNLKGANAVNF